MIRPVVSVVKLALVIGMTLSRHARDRPFRSFGSRKIHHIGAHGPSAFAQDIRLFALTFVGGFVFVSVYLA